MHCGPADNSFLEIITDGFTLIVELCFSFQYILSIMYKQIESMTIASTNVFI